MKENLLCNDSSHLRNINACKDQCTKIPSFIETRPRIYMNTCVSGILNLRINSSDDGCMTRFTWHEAVQAVLFIVGKTPVNCMAALACPC